MKEMKKMKIRIKNVEQSKLVQKLLFSMGYEWSYSGKTIMHYPYDCGILTDGVGCMMRLCSYDAFEMHKNVTKFTVKEITTVQLEEVKQETVKVGDKTYLKSDIDSLTPVCNCEKEIEHGDEFY